MICPICNKEMNTRTSYGIVVNGKYTNVCSMECLIHTETTLERFVKENPTLCGC